VKKVSQHGGGRGEKATGAQPARNWLDETGVVDRHSFGGDVHCSRDRDTDPSF